jgi:hypothetical protein
MTNEKMHQSSKVGIKMDEIQAPYGLAHHPIFV